MAMACTALAGVSIECVHGTTSLAVCAFEDAYQLAMASGKTPKVCLLTNPHNPLGIVYKEEDLREVLLWAMKKKLHLVSDEIYVNSIYEAAVEEEFVSMMDLSLDVLGTEEEDEKGKANEYVRDYVHTVFGFSKDFCCSGLRIGCLHTENKALITAWNGKFKGKAKHNKAFAHSSSHLIRIQFKKEEKTCKN